MRLIRRGITFTIVLLLLACGVRQTAEELWQTSENQLNAKKHERAIKSLETLVATYPDHPLAPRAQFQIGDIYMNNIEDLKRSLGAYKQTTVQFPGTDEGVKALFMIGFLNANHLEDFEAAREAYMDFMSRYPNHELVPSVKFELENLGKPVEDIDALKGITNAS